MAYVFLRNCTQNTPLDCNTSKDHTMIRYLKPIQGLMLLSQLNVPLSHPFTTHPIIDCQLVLKWDTTINIYQINFLN